MTSTKTTSLSIARTTARAGLAEGPIERGTPRADAIGLRSRRPAAGFTLLEVLVAWTILAMVMASLTGVQASALHKGEKAVASREVREMSDTVFRRFIYELQKYTDGQPDTGDHAYGEFAGLKGPERDRWKIYKLMYHKRKGMAAGTDPSGQSEDLFNTAPKNPQGSSSGGTSSGSGSSSGSGGSGASGSGTPGSAEASAGVEAYLLSLDVFGPDDDVEPILTLRTIVPIPESEQAETAK